MIDLLPHAIGVIAMIISIFAWQAKTSKNILLYYIPANLLWALQYFMLSVPVGALISLSTSGKDSIVLFANNRIRKIAITTFIITIWGVAFTQNSQWYDFVPVIGNTIFNIVLLMSPQNRQALSRACLLSSGSWIVYGMYTDAWVSVLSFSLVFISCLIGIVRHEGFKKPAFYLPQFVLLFLRPSQQCDRR